MNKLVFEKSTLFIVDGRVFYSDSDDYELKPLCRAFDIIWLGLDFVYVRSFPGL